MIAVGHTSVGVIVGVAAAQLLPSSIPLPFEILTAGAVGIASHYAMDLVPHGHYDFDFGDDKVSNRTLLIDLALPIVLVGLLLLARSGLGRESWLVGAGVLGAQLPDIFDGLLARGAIPGYAWAKAEHRFHESTHWHNPEDPHQATPQGGRKLGWSDLWQAVVALVALYLLLVA